MSKLWWVAVVVLAGCDARTPKPAPGRPPPPPSKAPPPVIVQVSEDAGPPRPRHRDDDAPLRRPKSILLAEAREEIGWKVADGFLSRDEIVDFVMGVVVDRASLKKEIEQITDEALEEHKQREATWQYPTDPDRLDRAFAALEQQGILARARFSDCASCTTADLQDARAGATTRGHAFHGWVLFTDQDAEGLSAGRELPLTFGAFDGSSEAIGRKIVQALTRVGLHPQWRSPADQRITLTGLEWHKRRFTRPRW